jgi:hypothetical protein
MEDKAISNHAVHMAVDVTNHALNQSTNWITEPDKVATFIEVVARKIDSLLNQSSPS